MECGPTWKRLADKGGADRIDNRPGQRASYEALERLAETVLDPVIDRFGPCVLTYGFSSPALSKAIRRGIAPRLDQHAASELNRGGKRICSRVGAAVDFFVEGASTLTIAKWIVSTCAFDRLYFYGPDRPVHVSVGPDESRQVVVMGTRADGRPIPRVYSLERFLAV